MSGECEGCTEHCLECNCVKSSIKLEKIKKLLEDQINCFKIFTKKEAKNNLPIDCLYYEMKEAFSWLGRNEFTLLMNLLLDRQCHVNGCVNLESKCKDCGRIVSSATIAKPMKWKSTKDEPPHLGEWCLIYVDDVHYEKKFHVSKYKGKNLFEISDKSKPDYGTLSCFTNYWMPLPLPPEEK